MLNLYLNGIPVDYNTFVFSGGEVHVKLPALNDNVWDPDPIESVKIFAHLRSSQDIMELLMLTDAVKRETGNFPIDLCIPYIPYARQDRVCDYGEALSIKVFADLINSQDYNSVEVWDPHSDVSTALINSVKVKKAYLFLDKIRNNFNNDTTVIVSPDAGANKKVFEAAKYLRLNTVVRADKTRDVKTGALSGTTVMGDVAGKTALIIDDIGDGLGTFILLGKKLKELGATKVVLYITHGIFSKGADIMEGAVDEIYCSNVWEENVRDRNTKGILKRDLG